MRLPFLAVVAAAVVVLALVVVLVSTQSGSGMLAVSVVLTHPKIPAGSTDRGTVVNDSGDWLTYGGCVSLLPRTGSAFERPSNLFECDAYAAIAPHSQFQIQGLRTSFRARTAGKYWLVFPYLAGEDRAPHRGTLRLAYTKLTVTG